MKRFSFLKLVAVFVLVAGFNQSCTNLDEEVFSQLTSSNTDLTQLTQDQLESAIADPYTVLNAIGSHNSFYSLQLVSGDDILIPHRGADWEDGGQWLRVNRHDYQSTEQAVGNGWNLLYQGVMKCNFVIDLLESLKGASIFDDADLTKRQSEMRGLRAYFYYWLMDMYGNIPLVTQFEIDDPAPATQSRQAVYDFITSELSEIKAALDKPTSAGAAYTFNYWAARALEARVFLNAEVYTGTAQWQASLDAANDVINNGPFSLESDYFVNFNESNEGSSENIMTVPCDASIAGGFNIAQMTLHYISQETFSLAEQPWNGYCALQEFYDSYDDADARKGVSGDQSVRGNFHAGPQYKADGVTPIVDPSVEGWKLDGTSYIVDPDYDAALPSDPDGAEIVFTPEINEVAPNALRQAGARIGKYEYASGAQSSLNNDFVLFRLAEVILNAAEAQYRLGNTANALALVNQVRSRASLADFASLDDASLLAERGRELFYEGNRRSDLIRFGEYNRAWFGKSSASDATKNLFPIPFDQLQANPNLTQNPGY
ncbi:MAG: RagB/SusD family nutrient uptake outer membrane protein [Saprospiraceae bacterium]